MGSDYTKQRFAETVRSDYWNRRTARETLGLSKTVQEVLAQRAETKQLGHPAALELPLGGRHTENMAVGFLDLRDFTGRTFWDDQDEVVDLAHAVLSGFIEVVDNYGGYPLGLRGDGLFMGFGGDPGFASVMALTACTIAIDAVQTEVNPWLASRGFERIQVRAGLDAGTITFVRTGNLDHSEVNPLGFAANFAAKCEKKAKSWEIVAGEGLVGTLRDQSDFTQHPESPKSYERHGERKYYRFYDFSWKRTLRNSDGVADALRGTSTSSIISS